MFKWIDVDNAPENIVAFVRRSPRSGREIVCVGNFSAVPRLGYRLGLPSAGEYRAVVNTDAEVYSGSGSVPVNSLYAEAVAIQGHEFSALVDLPPLCTLWFEAPE